MKKLLFYSIHYPKINPHSNPIRHPWGWISQACIKNSVYNHHRSDNMYDSLYQIEDPQDFKKGCFYAYHSIYQHYSQKRNFLDKNYCTPSLSIAINIFNVNPIVVRKLPVIQEIRIIDYWIQHEPTYSNNKILGLWNHQEVKTEFLKGLYGPETEMGHPSKRCVKVHFILSDRHDIWILEQNIHDNSDWQVSNINNVIIY